MRNLVFVFSLLLILSTVGIPQVTVSGKQTLFVSNSSPMEKFVSYSANSPVATD